MSRSSWISAIPSCCCLTSRHSRRHLTRSVALLQALWPCAFYFACSFAMNMVTKVLITTYQWHAIFTLGAIQNAFTLSVLLLHQCFTGAAALHGQSVGSGSSSHVLMWWRGLSLRYVVRVLLPLVALNVGSMLTGFAGMRVVNMPMYLVVRRLTTLKVMLIEWLVLGKVLSSGVKTALLVSALGSIVAGSTDVTSDWRGYAIVGLQNLCSAFSLTFSKESALSPLQLVLLNSAAATVVCGALAVAFERDAIVNFPFQDDARFVATWFAMCCLCVLYQFSVFTCTVRNSALATSVTGNIKDLLSTLCGFLFFSDVAIRAANVIGVVLSFVGAYSFSYLKYQAIVSKSATTMTSATNGKQKST
ncbi:TPA: hypothetical protein N0F65_000102 [Lagenidium giganteum]|uniref:Sugar phosphate transporter domain-containing protein n=1 Tax=Lagenidium giganteum TaxID=4803 RepID=A0AAV2YX72_9STRA|nr:TPA: hypothetical protein N0F65_000102 [Lagenidium giganteum]